MKAARSTTATRAPITIPAIAPPEREFELFEKLFELGVPPFCTEFVPVDCAELVAIEVELLVVLMALSRELRADASLAETAEVAMLAAAAGGTALLGLANNDQQTLMWPTVLVQAW